MLHVSRPTLRRMCTEGVRGVKLLAYRFGRSLRYDPRDVEAFLAAVREGDERARRPIARPRDRKRPTESERILAEKYGIYIP